MNINDMRVLVRRDLHDEAVTGFRWTDGEIDRHILHTVKDFSAACPEEAKAAKATAAGSRSLDISDITDRVMVEALEYPVDRFPPHFQRFALWGSRLTFLGEAIPDGSNTCIYYGRLHKIDALGSTVPALYEDLIVTGAAGYAAIQWAAYAINQVNTGGRQTPEEFLAWGKVKLGQFEERLKMVSQKNRVRVRSLYRPYRTAVSQTIDFGP